MSEVLITQPAKGQSDAIISLFAETFAASEGPEEGVLIGALAQDLLSDTADKDIRIFCAEDAGDLVGAGIFTRLAYPEDSRIVFILSPMAVATDRQGQGIGQRLLNHALGSLAAEGVDVAITYGDPSFYKQVGFRPIAEAQAQPPLRLSMPHGWIGQSLTSDVMPMLRGPSVCVPALDRQELW